jgi:hypothetical protein
MATAGVPLFMVGVSIIIMGVSFFEIGVSLFLVFGYGRYVPESLVRYVPAMAKYQKR